MISSRPYYMRKNFTSIRCYVKIHNWYLDSEIFFFLFYNKGTSKRMQSSKFGPPAWETMFTFAFGYYLNPLPCEIKDPEYITFFKLFGKVLPCKYCRDSYTKFFESLPIKEYLKQDYGLVRFIYDLKNLVNHKLESQEEKALYKEFTELKSQLPMESDEFWKQFRAKAHKICYTKPAPSFHSVLERLKLLRADCSSIEKHCRTPLEIKSNETNGNSGTGTILKPSQNDSILRNSVTGGSTGTRKKRRSSKRSVKKRSSKRRRSSKRSRARR